MTGLDRNMKSEHRHELNANELEKVTENIGKFFEQHGMKVLIGLSAAILVGVGVYFLVNMGADVEEAASTQLVNAENTDDYLAIADNRDYNNLNVQAYARLVGSERQLNDAIELYFTRQEGGLDDFKKIHENFSLVAGASGLPPAAKERALWGLAVCTECMSDGDTSAAVAALEEFLKEFPKSKYKSMAEESIKRLKTDGTKEFYVFLSSTDRKPADIEQPTDIMKKLQKIPGHESMIGSGFSGEKPVELPVIPRALTQDLEPEAPAFPTLPKKTDGKTKKTDDNSGPALKKFPSKTPAKASPAKTGTAKTSAAKKTSAPK